MRWAIAARSASKLDELKRSLGSDAVALESIVVDAADEAGLRRLCHDTRVVVSTVGPYALYGETLVKVCADTGTDYCDLTGEVQWIRRMIERYSAAAAASGARIVHCCGFDSIPSDFGVWFLQRESQRSFGKTCSRVKLRVKAMRGGFSGGTVASLLNVVKETRANPALRKELANPYSLCIGSSVKGVRQPSGATVALDADFRSWTAPFVMSGINTRIVHRSNLLQSHSYGADFVYDEAVLTGRGLRGRLAAMGAGAGLAAFMVASSIGPVRGLLSGGTVASLLNGVKETRANPALRKELANPYSLCIGSSVKGVRQPSGATVALDADFRSWTAPFVMSGINTRIVHRSNLLQSHSYGADFVYDEAVLTGRGLRGRLAAMGAGAGLAAFMVASSIGPVRGLLERYVLPKPGEGPSPIQQERGFFDLRLFGRTNDGRNLRVKVTGDRDPGYGSTAKMLGEAAACLAFDVSRAEVGGGFWTPASALGEKLLARLQAHAGLGFERQDD